ncbi:MAG: GAF domain-containing protein [Bacteroidales bacterium]
MKFRFTIANKIGIGIGILMVFVLLTSIFTWSTLQLNLRISTEINKLYQPSAELVDELSIMMTESKMLIKNWVAERNDSTAYKLQLINLHNKKYIQLRDSLKKLSAQWELKDKIKIDSVFSTTDQLFVEHKKIMKQLATTSDYDIATTRWDADAKVEETGLVMKLTDRILIKLNELSSKFDSRMLEENIRMSTAFNKFRNLIIWTGVILFFTILIVGFILTTTLVNPINQLRKVLLEMSQGELPDKQVKAQSDEIGEMGKALNNLISGLWKISLFSKEIGKGNYESQFTPLGPNDELGNALLLMRENLKKASEDAEMRRIENFQRSWTSQGLAEFGEMLRESKDSLEELTNQILTRLVRYLDASVGGLFIINDDNKEDTYLELIAYYAYDRRKYVEKRIEIGQTLVGQCVLENETIFMTEIPKDYIHISSGMGNDDPKSLLIVPLKLNQEVYGVVELASFNTFESYQIEFVEKIGESIASTISSAKINIHTSKLLQESNEKSERLSKQEEETRKQIEEMQKSIVELKAQEERDKEQTRSLINQFKSEISSLRKANEEQNTAIDKIKIEFKNIDVAVQNSIGTYSLSINGEFIEANDRYLKMAGLTFNELKGKKLDDLMTEEIAKEADIQNFIPNLLSGHVYRKINEYVINNESHWFYETFTPFYDEDGKFSKIFCIVSDFTSLKSRESEQEKLISKLQDEIKKLRQRMI